MVEHQPTATKARPRSSERRSTWWIVTRYGLPFLTLLFAAADPLLYRAGWSDLADLPFYLALSTGLCWVLVVANGPMRRLLAVRVDASLLPVARVLYAVICLFTAVQRVWAVQFEIEPSSFDLLGWPEDQALAYVLYAVYIAALVAVLFGKWLRAAWIVLFLFGGLLMAHTLESVLKIPLNFFAMFIPPALWRGDRSAETPWSGWPLMMSGICVAVTITAAGFFKLIDPVWQEGMGFYYSVALPFLSPKHLWPLLDSWPMMWLGNWATIVVECVTLPLFLLRRTRAIGVVCIAALGLFLSWPMQSIGLGGGSVLLAFAPAWAGLSPTLTRWWHRLPWARSGPVREDGPDRRGPAALPLYAVAIAWWTVIGSVGAALSKYDEIRCGIPVLGMYTYQGPCRRIVPDHVAYRIKDVSRLIYATRPDRLHEVCWVVELFDYHHFFERSTYRIRVEDAAGRWRTVDFFDNDGSILPGRRLTDYSTLEPMMSILRLRHRDRARSVAYDVRTIDDIVRYAIHLSGADTPPKRAVLDVRPLHMPGHFAGLVRPWADGDQYKPFYEYDVAAGRGRVIGAVSPYPYETLDVPAFREKRLVPIPDAPVDHPMVAPGSDAQR